jgi:hypothetical protein
MKHLSRRRFITLAVGAAGIACVPRKLLFSANAGLQYAEPWPSCPRTLPSSGDDENPLVYLLVAMPDAGAGSEFPERYRPSMHVCYPPTRRPCWCGGWHGPDDPVDLALVVGTPQPDLRVRPEALVLHIQPTGAPSIAGSTANVVEGPVVGFGSWAARAVGQISEPILVPGMIGISFADIPPFLRENRELRFAFGSSPTGILDAGEIVVARARPWLTCATNLLVRITGRPDTTLEDVNTLCMTIAETAHADMGIAFAATISDEENTVGVMGG